MRAQTVLPFLCVLSLGWLVQGSAMAGESHHAAQNRIFHTAPAAPYSQSAEEAAVKSSGCLTCHTEVDLPSMHKAGSVTLGCADCHGGDASVRWMGKPDPQAKSYAELRDRAHVLPRYPDDWNYPKSALPKRSYTLLNRESPEFIRFRNPSDYRVAREACGACHLPIINAAERSLMATNVMFWGIATYNNGILDKKNFILGESYTREGEPASLKSPPFTKTENTDRNRMVEAFVPLPTWGIIPPGDIFRVFERGGRTIGSGFPEIGNPNISGNIQKLEEPGRPDLHQSNRGPGTGLRIAVPALNIHKTRLNDPLMWFMGTNDQPGDYRQSGCSGCHVIYANDRDPRHSSIYAAFGHDGFSQQADPTIPRQESGHAIKHGFTTQIPSSQCMVCHMHQPNMFMNTYLGYTMWDYESDAPAMWPSKQKYPTAEELRAVLDRNPEGAAPRGNWSDVEFLKTVADRNPEMKDTQFADYHGHGWNFRAIHRRDRKGNLLDKDGGIIAPDDPKKWSKAIHMSSVHVDAGMQCVDCHFAQDSHGNGYIHGEVSSAIEITCRDCHGTSQSYPTLRTSGPAAPPGGSDISAIRNADGRPRFEWKGDHLIQRSAVDPAKEWDVSLVKNSVDPKHPRYNAKAARAKLMNADPTNQKWGPGISAANLAHKDDEMACYTCHLSWTTSCGGCHLPIEANSKSEIHRYEGGETRNFATYNPQVAREDMFQLGKHSPDKGGIIAPFASRSALILSSTNTNREKIYVQQPPIAASGFSSQAFAPHYPHTERKTETKTCTDCHLSADGDNNAIMAQLFLQGTNFVNFIGLNAWVGEEGGVEALRVTEWEEPQAVIGSYLQKYAYPDFWNAHQARGRELTGGDAGNPPRVSLGGGRLNCLQLRGEYLYAAEGANGLHVLDVASVANKGISQKIIEAPSSPLGHNTVVGSKNASCVALPTNQPIAPTRNEGKIMREDNQEQELHPIYHYALVTDEEEGLILVNIDTMADGEPRNNFLSRALTWNEKGILSGARHLTIAGHFVYIATPKAMVVLDLDDPLKPKLISQIPANDPKGAAVQFRYLFFTDKDGLKVADITHPDRARLVPEAMVALKDAHKLYVARTFAYIAGGSEGLVIIDIERPEQPKLYARFNADNQISDARDVVVGSTNASLFAYVADGVNGLKVIQLTSPASQPNYYGFSPDPKPELIAWSKTRWPALALSKGLDRDRAVDETGHQIAVVGRKGARPFTLSEMQRFYLTGDTAPWTVSDQIDLKMFDRTPVSNQPLPKPDLGPRRRPGDIGASP